MSKHTSAIWWAGYIYGIASIIIAAEVVAAITAKPASSEPKVMITMAVLLILYSAYSKRKAEKALRDNTVEIIKPSLGYQR